MHLFRVAAGLDSMVPGEGEILGQVRSAYEDGAPGPVLDRLFRQALHAGKKVRAADRHRREPGLRIRGCRGAGAGGLRRPRRPPDPRRRRGEGRRAAARNLLSRGAEIAFVANRTTARAAELAARFGAQPLPLERIREELERADVVVSSTSAPGFVVRREDVEAALPARRGRRLFLIDLAVPRDLDPSVHELEDCFLYDIDDLERVVAQSLAGRRQ